MCESMKSVNIGSNLSDLFKIDSMGLNDNFKPNNMMSSVTCTDPIGSKHSEVGVVDTQRGLPVLNSIRSPSKFTDKAKTITVKVVVRFWA